MRHVNQAKNDRLYKLYGKCEYAWPDKKNEDHDHKCKRVKGHGTRHRCKCGAGK